MKRRKKILVKKGMQFRYLGLVLISVILPTLLVGACFYWLIFTIMAQQLAIPESIAYNLLPAVKRVNTILIVGLPIVLVGLAAWGLMLSHRIAGPVSRLERELEQIAQGDFSIRIKFRRKDELGTIAEGINKVLDRIEKDRKGKEVI